MSLFFYPIILKLLYNIDDYPIVSWVFFFVLIWGGGGCKTNFKKNKKPHVQGLIQK